MEIDFSKEEQEYIDYNSDHYTCARITSDGDFCPVHLTHAYGVDVEDNEIGKAWGSCEYEPLSNRSDPNCQATNCMQYASEFVDDMGCCGTAILGNITRCIDTPEVCSYAYASGGMGVTGSATFIILVMIVMVLVNAALLG